MNKIKTEKNRFIPKYSIVPIVVYLLIMPLYFFVQQLAKDKPHHVLSVFLDDFIPFVPIFAWIYVLAYVQWFLGYLLIARSERKVSETFFMAEVVGRIIAVIFFFIYPTTLERPNLDISGPSEWLVSIIYTVDEPSNLFPSLHCMESWIVMRGVWEGNYPKWLKYSMAVFSILVFMSVVLVKQHLFLDIPAGIILGEFAIFLSKKLDLGRFYRWVEKRLGW